MLFEFQEKMDKACYRTCCRHLDDIYACDVTISFLTSYELFSQTSYDIFFTNITATAIFTDKMQGTHFFHIWYSSKLCLDIFIHIHICIGTWIMFAKIGVPLQIVGYNDATKIILNVFCFSWYYNAGIM